MKSLNCYKAGLAVLGLLTIALLVGVLVQAGSAKQDNITDRKANDIATKLNNYISNKQEVPESLSRANINDVPSTITYKKLGGDSYKFCVTYKSASSDFSSSSAVEDAIYQGVTGVPSGIYDDTGSSNTNDSNGYLYLGYTHKKGETCHTITSAVYQDSYNDTSTNSTDPSIDGSGISTISDPKEASIASGAQDTVCYLSGYATHYAGKVASVATNDGKPIAPTTTQDLIIKVTPDASSTVKGDQTITVSQISHNIFSSSCTAIAHQSVKVGDYVSVFGANNNQYGLDAIVDFSRNQ